MWVLIRVPHCSTSNEYHNLYLWRNKKNVYPDTHLSRVMQACRNQILLLDR